MRALERIQLTLDTGIQRLLQTRVSIILDVCAISIPLHRVHVNDNAKVLLEAPLRPGHLRNSALLTIDLTKAVADEAIARRDSIIIAYRKVLKWKNSTSQLG